MTPEQLAVIKNEYEKARQWKQPLNRVAFILLDEFGMKSQNPSYGADDLDFYRYVDYDDNAFLEQFARVGHLNVYCRKLNALLNAQDPSFTMENINPGDEAIAELLEHAFEDMVRQIKLKRHSKALCLLALLTGTGITKTGLTSQFVYGEEPYAGRVPQNIDADLGDDAEWPQGELTEPTNFAVRAGDPNVINVPSWNLFTNPGARTLDEVRRFYHLRERPLIDVLRDERLDRKARRQIVPSSSEVDEAEERHEPFPEEEETLRRELRMVKVIEVFDRPSRHYAIFTEEAERPLLDWTPFDLPIEHPYRFFCPIPHPTSMWGFPYAYLLVNQTQGINLLRAKIVDAISRDAKTVLAYDSNAIDSEEASEFREAKDGMMLPIKGLGDNPNFMQTVKFGGANPELLNLQSLLEGDLNFMSGLDDVTRNVYRSGSDATATEIATRQQQQGVTIEDIRDQFEGHLEDVSEDLLRIMLQVWGEERIIKVVGDDPRLFFWIAVERQRVLNNFSIKVNAGSTEKLDKAAYRRQLIDLTPRILEIKQHIDNDAMRTMQGLPPSEVNSQELLRLMLEAFDPRLANKILRRRDPVALLQRLIQQHHMFARGMSPELQQQLQLRMQPPQQMGMMGQGQPGQMPENVVSFEERTRNPQAMAMQFGQPTQDTAAGQTGRMLSEARGM